MQLEFLIVFLDSYKIIGFELTATDHDPDHKENDTQLQ